MLPEVERVKSLTGFPSTPAEVAAEEVQILEGVTEDQTPIKRSTFLKIKDWVCATEERFVATLGITAISALGLFGAGVHWYQEGIRATENALNAADPREMHHRNLITGMASGHIKECTFDITEVYRHRVAYLNAESRTPTGVAKSLCDEVRGGVTCQNAIQPVLNNTCFLRRNSDGTWHLKDRGDFPETGN